MTYLNVTVHVSLPTPRQDGLPLSPVELVEPFVSVAASLMPNSMTTQSPGWMAWAILSKRPSRVNYVCCGLARSSYHFMLQKEEETYRARGSSGISGVVYASVGTERILEVLSPAFCAVVTAIRSGCRVTCYPDGRYCRSCS
jgi:hypothetical protein